MTNEEKLKLELEGALLAKKALWDVLLKLKSITAEADGWVLHPAFILSSEEKAHKFNEMKKLIDDAFEIGPDDTEFKKDMSAP